MEVTSLINEQEQGQQQGQSQTGGDDESKAVIGDININTTVNTSDNNTNKPNVTAETGKSESTSSSSGKGGSDDDDSDDSFQETLFPAELPSVEIETDAQEEKVVNKEKRSLFSKKKK